MKPDSKTTHFQQMYIFTVLSVLMGGALWVVSHTTDIKDAVAALLNIIAGGLLAQLSQIVSSVFNSLKQRDDPSRATDITGARVSTTQTTETLKETTKP